jgi:hypothetical protein
VGKIFGRDGAGIEYFESARVIVLRRLQSNAFGIDLGAIIIGGAVQTAAATLPACTSAAAICRMASSLLPARPRLLSAGKGA